MKGLATDQHNTHLSEQNFLPDFHANSIVFLVVLIAELLALVLALTTTHQASDFWLNLAQLSFLVQWIALGAVVTLCYFSQWIFRLQVPLAALVIYGLIQLVTLLFSCLALWMMNHYDSGASREPFSFILRNLAISSIISLVALRYFYVQHQWKKNIEAEARARLQALQARIRPHFLFNSLNTIASLIPYQPEQAEQATLDLAELFRFSLEQKDKIRLEEELDITRRYLAMESLRLGERLQVTWQLDAGLPMDELIPALILQPLVENAIYHGIQLLTTGGRIIISVEICDDTLRFTVTNPRPSSRTMVSRNGNRIAQDNICQRLALAYGTQSPLNVREAADQYSVSFAIPRKAKQTIMTENKNTVAQTV